ARSVRLTVNLGYLLIDGLELKIYNPDKIAFDDIFDKIYLSTGGNPISYIHDQDHIDLYEQVLKTERKIRTIDDFMYIPLHFFQAGSLLERPVYHDIKLECFLKKEIHNISNFALYANKYDYNCILPQASRSIIIHQMACDIFEFNNTEVLEDKIRLNFRHQLFALSIVLQFSTDNIAHFSLRMGSIDIFKISPDELNDLNYRLGYTNLKYPVFILGDLRNDIYKQIDSLIDFNQVDLTLCITYKKRPKISRSYKTIAINSNIFRIVSGMSWMPFI
ncbi:MAG: hypothetical protein AABY22_24010, partial [Nanoarchaeota archaeon]